MSTNAAILNLPEADRLAVESVRAVGIGWKSLLGGNANTNESGYAIDDPERAKALEEHNTAIDPQATEQQPNVGLSAGDVVLRAEMAAVVTARDAGYQGTDAAQAMEFNHIASEANLGDMPLQLAEQACERINEMVQGA